MSSATASLGRMTPGLRDIIIAPRHSAALNNTPIIYCNSSSATPSETIGKAPTFTEVRWILKRITEYGFTIFAPDLDLTWGSRPDLIDDAIEFAQARGFDQPPILIGSSHGGACALSYAANHPNDVAGVVGIIPAIDVGSLRAADTMGVRAVTDLAFGVVYPAPVPDWADPMLMTDELSSVPIRIYTSSNDAVSMNHAQFAALTGAEDIDVGPVGHSNQAGINIDKENLAVYVNGLSQ